MRAVTYILGSGFLGVSLLLTGCSGARLLMPTPNVHLDENRNFYGDLAPELKNNEVQLIYITDRVPEQDEQGNLRYGYERSPSLAFGNAVVELGVGITWDELLEASRTHRRLKPVKLELREVEEIARGPQSPLPYTEIGGLIVEEPALVAERAEVFEDFRLVMARRLELTPRKEVFIYVHGYHNSFADAAFAMAELWHFLGHIGVPIVYTWPAGYPGLFGYTYDRESSEFTVYHLRQVLAFISGMPEVEKIHLIAHSRGTDIAVDALRELTIAARAAGINPREKFKIHNFVLAAPDLDVQVAMQRIAGDKLAFSADRTTVYTSPSDKALSVAAKLFASPRGRVGTLGLGNAPDNTRAQAKFSGANIAFVNFSGVSGSQADRYGHSYFRDAPTVSSDLVLMLRDDLDPGTPGRPLEPMGAKFWRVPSAYPAVQPAR